MLTHIERVTQHTFRMLVLGIFISVIYDLFWFSINASAYNQDQASDGGMERKLRIFTLYMSYISFFVRMIMGLIFWKDSLDFDTIMLGKKVE